VNIISRFSAIWHPDAGPTTITMHSTRLFPKNFGASSYRLTGIAARCDWVIMTDAKAGDGQLIQTTHERPRTIFLSMRGHHRSLSYFFEEILPKVDSRYVLVSGSEDLTVPTQIDARWRPYNGKERRIIDSILEDDRLIHWFIENRDQAMPKTSSLPVGYVFPESDKHDVHVGDSSPALRERELRILCAHRVRSGPQWEVRRQVSRLCREQLPGLATVIDTELSEASFIHEVRKHPFVICAQGGGLDPSPKAWVSIANGSIPIIVSSPLRDAYAHLPVAVVDSWTDSELTIDKLRAWLTELGPFYEDRGKRKRVLARLSLDYWWDLIAKHYVEDRMKNERLRSTD
jgi:hypothetical protein